MKTHQHTPDPYLLRTPPVLTEIVNSNASRAEPGMCAHGYCFLDPARPCAGRCKYLQAKQSLESEDPLEFIRGVESDANRLKTAAFAVALVLALASILYITAI